MAKIIARAGAGLALLVFAASASAECARLLLSEENVITEAPPHWRTLWAFVLAETTMTEQAMAFKCAEAGQ